MEVANRLIVIEVRSPLNLNKVTKSFKASMFAAYLVRYGVEVNGKKIRKQLRHCSIIYLKNITSPLSNIG